MLAGLVAIPVAAQIAAKCQRSESVQMATVTGPRGSMGDSIEDEPLWIGLDLASGPDVTVYGCPASSFGAECRRGCTGTCRDMLDGCDPFPRASVAGIAVTEHFDTDEADQTEVERINMAGARYRESVRLVPFGAEPWDHGAGEAA